ncbi:hypothetical protein IFM89_015315, partial [Coptis chinensis]
ENKEKLGSKNGNDQYDIAIVGGGMVGMALACALCKFLTPLKLSVTIIDSNPALGKEVNIKKDDLPDPRVNIVTLASISFFKGNYGASGCDLRCAMRELLHSSLLSCLQRFLPSGPIALLPIGDEFSNIVWTMIPKEATERKSMSEDDFVKAVNHGLHDGYDPNPQSNYLGYSRDYSWEVPPKVVELGLERMVFPLSLKHANEYAVNRVVLIGDAAHTIHPLAGQGVNLGFGDACALPKIIADGIAVGADLGEDHVASHLEERECVVGAGGQVRMSDGLLTHGGLVQLLSRSIGDDDLKPAVTAEPEVTETTLTYEDEFLVMASDGLWDVVSNEDVVSIIRDTVKEPGMCSKRLVTKAAERGSKDNITAVVA